MELDKKGITLVEIIVSIVLISIVLIFLAILLVDVKDMNDSSKNNSTYLINKSLLTKLIEQDLINDEDNSITILSCSVKNDIYTGYTQVGGNLNFNECLKISFTENDYAFIGIYYIESQSSYVFSYIHDGVIKKTEKISEFEKYNVGSDGNLKNTNLGINVTYVGTTNDIETKYYNEVLGSLFLGKKAIVINIPMIGSDGKDYTISIPFYGQVTI